MSLLTFDTTTTTTYVAPKRFDTHTVGSLQDWVRGHIDAGRHDLTIDASNVRFVDVATLESIDALATEHPRGSIEIASPSVAMSLTLEFLRPAASFAEVA
jgi:anti-anti-sigma regulatory factor